MSADDKEQEETTQKKKPKKPDRPNSSVRPRNRLRAKPHKKPLWKQRRRPHGRLRTAG